MFLPKQHSLARSIFIIVFCINYSLQSDIKYTEYQIFLERAVTLTTPPPSALLYRYAQATFTFPIYRAQFFNMQDVHRTIHLVGGGGGYMRAIGVSTLYSNVIRLDWTGLDQIRPDYITLNEDPRSP